uniref:Uncharacterized protein n=1 Tax=Ditylum brightwellii TaxID=49249 RepID=A0A7S1ZL36_9STRA|mmetsp:Transcript_34163/g.51018  ORF Transcript_34163/g.51018 Transcript_34163/m.51018 type:complete len:106 (+) Transcript_34163:174-491(+)
MAGTPTCIYHNSSYFHITILPTLSNHIASALNEGYEAHNHHFTQKQTSHEVHKISRKGTTRQNHQVQRSPKIISNGDAAHYWQKHLHIHSTTLSAHKSQDKNITH